MMRWTRRILLFIILLAVIGFVVYTKVFRPLRVIGYEVDRDDLVIEVMGTGSVQARVSAVISSKIQGRLDKVAVDQGDLVTKDQVIARLDDRDLTRQVEIAKANAQASQAGFDRLHADQARAQAVLRQAQRDLTRTKESFDQGAANESEIDKAEEQLAIAQADLARSKSAIAEGKMLLIAAEKTLEYQQARLEDTVIAAPFDGLIIRRDRDPGDIIVPGSAIYELVSLDEIWASVWIDETAMAGLAPNQPARVLLRSQLDKPLSGHVVRLGRETDSETREFLVDIAIDQLPERWAIGQRVDVYIETDRIEHALAVPMSYLVAIDGEQGVFVLKENRAEWSPCTLGKQGRDSVEIIEGVSAGDVLLRTADASKGSTLKDQKKVVVQ